MPAPDTEVAVVGAGITGAAAAYELTRAGRTVVLVEQYELGHARGSSHGASRVFRLSYPEPGWIRRAQDALVGWRRLESASGDQLLRTTGSVDVGSYAAANADALAACGIPASTLEPGEARARWGLRVGSAEVALFQADAGVLAAERAHRLLVDGARSGGALIVPRTRVLELAVEHDHVRLSTRAGAIRAGVAVVAAGAWSAPLLATIGIDLDVTPTRETVAYLDLDAAAELPVLLFERERDRGHGVGTYALADDPATLKVGVHRTGPETDPDEQGEPATWVADQIREWVAARLPERSATLRRAETCLYTNTADESFVLRRHGRVVVASACSGHAFKFAPTTGRTIAALAAEAIS